jgi:hypothetical protein
MNRLFASPLAGAIAGFLSCTQFGVAAQMDPQGGRIEDVQVRKKIVKESVAAYLATGQPIECPYLGNTFVGVPESNFIQQHYGGNLVEDVINLPNSSFQSLGSYGTTPGTRLGDTSTPGDLTEDISANSQIERTMDKAAEDAATIAGGGTGSELVSLRCGNP